LEPAHLHFEVYTLRFEDFMVLLQSSLFGCIPELAIR
jgi:hypothetical protein